MKFPVIVFEKDDQRMFGLDYPYLMGDKRFINVGFRNVTMIDSDGKVFNVKEVIQDSGLLFWQSIKMVGLMVKLKPIIIGEPKSINLEELKNRIINHVEKYPKVWLPINTVSGIQEMVEQAKSFKELILIFR